MKTAVKRWGNSLGLRIPKALAREAEIDHGSEVDLRFKSGELIIRPVRPKHYSLHQLIPRISKANLHGSVDTGKPVGREVW